MKVMMTSRAQQMSIGASSGSCPRTPPASSPQVPPRKGSATSTPQLQSPPGVPLHQLQRRLRASGQESEESESGEDWTGTGASSDSGISGAALRHFNPLPPTPYEHSLPRPPIDVPTPRPPIDVPSPRPPIDVPPPLPPRDPVVPDVQDSNPYMAINIDTLDRESEYMTMRLRHNYETVGDYVQSDQQTPNNQDSYLFMVPGNTRFVRNGSVPSTHNPPANLPLRFQATYENSSEVNGTGT